MTLGARIAGAVAAAAWIVVQFVGSIGGLALHGWAIWLSYSSSGFFGAFLAFIGVGIAEVYWFIRLWREEGLWGPFNVACLAWFGLMIVSLALGGALSWLEHTSERVSPDQDR